MSEQEKMDQERVAFEAWMHTYDFPPALEGEIFNDERYLDVDCFGQFFYDDLATQRCWSAWQARASLPVGVPDGYMPIPTAEQLADALSNVRCFHDMSAELIAPELLANLLASTTVKAEQLRCATCQGSGIVGHSEVCPECQDTWQPAPSLPAAGSAVEEVEVVAVVRPIGLGRVAEPVNADSLYLHCSADDQLMTVAQHSRIVAALSAQQSAHVSVPREWLDAVKELFDAKQAKDDFERENPGNSTKRWDACLYRIEAAEDALRALLNGGEA